MQSAWIDLSAFRKGGTEKISPIKVEIRERQEKIEKVWEFLENNGRSPLEDVQLITDAMLHLDIDEDPSADSNLDDNENDYIDDGDDPDEDEDDSDDDDFDGSDKSDEDNELDLDELGVENDYIEGMNFDRIKSF